MKIEITMKFKNWRGETMFVALAEDKGKKRTGTGATEELAKESAIKAMRVSVNAGSKTDKYIDRKRII